MKTSFLVPIYEVRVFVVTGDVKREWQKMEQEFGPPEGDGEAVCVSANDGNFALFFPPNPRIELVAHEVFHLTHTILSYVGAPVVSESHENAALLHGYLAREVASRLKK